MWILSLADMNGYCRSVVGAELNSAPVLPLGAELLEWSLTSISTAQQAVETAHDIQHPKSVTSAPKSAKPYGGGSVLGKYGQQPGVATFD